MPPSNEEKKNDDNVATNDNTNDDQHSYSIPCCNLNNSTHLSTLTTLNLRNCNLDDVTMSSSLTKYATNLKQLDISDNPKLTSLPSDLVNLNQLEILFVSNCPGIKTLPPVLGQMTSITRLGWKSGSLTSVPHESVPPNIVHLILTNNAIADLQDERIFTKLTKVRKLMLSHNAITILNAEGVSLMRNVELIRLSGNDLAAIPETLWKLPKLTWLTLSGNPRLKLPYPETSQVPMVDLSSSLDFCSNEEEAFLGRGASGMVVRATYLNNQVAVKRIHSVTSDGRPEDELKSYGALNKHAMEERMVGAVALFHDAKQNDAGIIMECLPEGVVDLALPPTIVEVTTDRYDENERFKMVFITNVLKDISRALCYLHYKVGLVHGDMYAHNIKVDKSTGRAYLLDLGASYVPLESDREKAERLEVRAFGVLMGELLDRYDESDESKEDAKVWKDLVLLKDQCTEVDVMSRPSFKEIALVLSSAE